WRASACYSPAVRTLPSVTLIASEACALRWEMPLMLNARFFFGVAVVAGALVATSAAFAQEADTDYLLAQAERSYPESKIPVLFGPSSLSESFATEVDDPSWSSQTESRILDEVADHYADGLRYKRAQVECRTATCVLLLSYVAAPEG